MKNKVKILIKHLENFEFQYALADDKSNIIYNTDSFDIPVGTMNYDSKINNFIKNGYIYTKLDKDLFILTKENDCNIQDINRFVKIIYDEIINKKRKNTSIKELLEMITFDYTNNEAEINKLISKKGIDENNSFVLAYVKYETKPVVYVEEIAAKLFPKDAYLGDVRMDQLEEIIYLTLSEDVTLDDIIEYCNALIQIHETEYNLKLEIGISGLFGKLSDCNEAINKAKMAMQMGEVFFKNTKVYSYDKLGVAKILYALPEEFKIEFVKESNKKNKIDLLDDELLHTCEALFNNNLNISETARQLYIHRNTLVYRIEKVKKLTDLDITNFDDASLLRTILLIKSSLKGV